MKKILALAAVAALTAGVSAYAANPFSDVTADDWAYQAVSDLSAQGVVEGYPDGTFKGERNMTRYELAQIVARLMAKEDQLNAQQQATLDKLAGEYADELANLGVRVSNLEKKVGNISWSGDARMRYINKAKTNDKDAWDGRLRLTVKGQVNDSTYAQGRIATNMWFKDAGDDVAKDGNTTMDRLFVNHNFGDKTSVVLGRQDLTVFGGLEYDDAFDGAKLAYNDGKFDAYAAFGRLKSGDTKDDAAFGGLGYDFGAAKLNAAYFHLTSDKVKDVNKFDSIWGANLVVPVQDFSVFGEYWDSNADKADTTWQAGLGYSTLDAAKPGTFALNVAYNRVGAGAYLGGTTYDASDFFGAIADGKDLKFWNVFGDVVLQKNVTLHGEYAWDIENTNTGYDDNAWTVSLNYAF